MGNDVVPKIQANVRDLIPKKATAEITHLLLYHCMADHLLDWLGFYQTSISVDI